jgi:hypothetical protein
VNFVLGLEPTSHANGSAPAIEVLYTSGGNPYELLSPTKVEVAVGPKGCN